MLLHLYGTYIPFETTKIKISSEPGTVNMEINKNRASINTASLNINGELMPLSPPLVMGILNVTPDSFFDGGKYTKSTDVKQHIEKMLDEGADIIDIGAVSTRPGSSPVSADEEKSRLLPVLEICATEFPNSVFSLDTTSAKTAQMAVNDFNVAIINDISAGGTDPDMYETIAGLDVPYIAMHMQGTPASMQKNPKYNDIVNEIIDYFVEKIFKLREYGIKDIIVDPGFGFGKTLEHNFTMLRELNKFLILDCPILIGASRKSMIHKLLNITPDEALNGTTVIHTLALLQGASVLRVHDVKEAKETVKLLDFYQKK